MIWIFIDNLDGVKINKSTCYIASICIAQPNSDFMYSKWETIQVFLRDQDEIIDLPEFIVIQQCHELWISNFDIVKDPTFQKITKLIIDKFKDKLDNSKTTLIIRKSIWKVRFTYKNHKRVWFKGYSLYSFNNVISPTSILNAKDIICKLPNHVGFTMEIPKEWVEENTRYYYALSSKTFVDILKILQTK